MAKIKINKKNIAGKLATVVLVAASILCVYVVVQVLTQGYVNFFGYSVFRVVTGSMEPTIAPGALLISQEVPIDQIQVGDIVCFRSREANMLGKSITHRVIGIIENGSQICLETRGDANPVADVLPVLQSNLIGKVIAYTGQNNVLADIMSFLTSGPGFMICVVLPCLWICGLILQECVGNIRQELSDAMDEMVEQAPQPAEKTGITQAEYEQIYEKVLQEVLAEKDKIQSSE
jgi:signal peptidase